LWGKFGQRLNFTNTEFVTETSRFYELLLDDRLTDMNILYISEEMVQVNYRYKDVFVEDNYNTNIFVAIFTTANARLRLYKKLEELDTAVIYCDTDSIVYEDMGTNTIHTGDLLGEWTDELGADTHIKLWVSAGPKSYYYITSKDEEITKVKGFTLHYKNLQKINGQALLQLVEGEIENIRVTNNEIVRDKVTKNLINKTNTKTLTFNFDKRKLCANYDT